jgi:peptidoglycan/LPS O-acetylase OafA/YrhL
LQKELKYLPPLDGVRATAAFMVMFFHFFQNGYYQDSALLLVQKFAFWGQTGVSLFFVLSGFLITRILFYAKTGRHYFKNFFIRRSLRIFPLYFFYLILFYFISPLIIQTRWSSFQEQWYFWFYLQDFSLTFHWPSFGPMHFWSLAIEEHFYLFWPILVYYTPKYHLKKVIITLLLIAPLCRYLLADNGYETFYFTFARMDELSLGALLALLESQNALNSNNKKTFLLGGLLTGVFTVILWTFFFGKSNLWIQVVKYDLIALVYFFGLGYVILAQPQSWLYRFFSHPMMTFLGSISYGLYVYHAISFPIIKRSFLSQYPTIIGLSCAFGLTVLISWISYRLMEKPIMSFKNKFLYQ